jgi:DNA polymerase III alpha subunit
MEHTNTLTMTRDEFELRYRSFWGMSTKFNLNRDQDLLLQLVKITNQGNLKKSLVETSPDDLKQFTYQTYSPFKVDFIQQHKQLFPGKDPRFSLADYVERLEYELKVIKEMGFNSYFLIVSDYVRWAKDHQIVVGP